MLIGKHTAVETAVGNFASPDLHQPCNQPGLVLYATSMLLMSLAHKYGISMTSPPFNVRTDCA